MSLFVHFHLSEHNLRVIFQGTIYSALLCAVALCSSFSGHCELFPQPDRNAEPQSGVDQVTAEQSFFLNASIYP